MRRSFIKTREESNVVSEIELSSLTFPQFKCRSNVDQKSLMNLYTNIQQVGLLNPVLVREMENDKWEIISGVKRTMVFQQMGKERIPAYILKDIDDKQALIIGISDNLNRDDLNVFDAVNSLLHLMVIVLNKTEEEIKAILNRIDNFEKGKIQTISTDDQNAEKEIEEILAKFGRTKINSFIIKMRIMNVSPILVDAVRYKGLHYTFALEINRVKDAEKQKELLEEVLDQHLSIKEIKAKVQVILGIAEKPNPFQNLNKKLKVFNNLPQDKKETIQKKVQEIEALLAG